MAHRLEARVPFLDSRLVEFLMKIPPQYKVGKNIETKHLLKKAAEGILPNNIIYRKKMGFAAPVSEWLRTHWFDYAKNEILNSYFVKENIFNPSFINSMLYKHKNGDKNFSKEIYSLLMLSLWHKRYF
jgi:asparagine synthase (glutamine-hydrolysing)